MAGSMSGSCLWAYKPWEENEINPVLITLSFNSSIFRSTFLDMLSGIQLAFDSSACLHCQGLNQINSFSRFKYICHLRCCVRPQWNSSIVFRHTDHMQLGILRILSFLKTKFSKSLPWNCFKHHYWGCQFAARSNTPHQQRRMQPWLLLFTIPPSRCCHSSVEEHLHCMQKV